MGNFYTKNGIGYKLASVGPRKLIKNINYFILSLGMGFDYSNNMAMKYGGVAFLENLGGILKTIFHIVLFLSIFEGGFSHLWFCLFPCFVWTSSM